jgi:hypothetical protein
MRKLGIGLALGVLLAGTSAFAQTDGPAITSVQTYAYSYVAPESRDIRVICEQICLGSLPVFGLDDLPTASGNGTFPTSTFFSPVGNASWTSVSTGDETTPTLSFESGNSVGAVSAQQNVVVGDSLITGSNILMLSESGVDIGITNGANIGVHSSITPAGFGFYVADVTADPGCVLSSSCQQVSPLSTYSFQSFASASQPGTVIAEVGFDFSVADYTGFIDVFQTPLFTVHGTLTLNSSGDLITSDLSDAIAKLTTFSQVTPAVTDTNPLYHSLGYGWLEQGFDVNLLEFSNHTVQYYTSVYSYSNAPCLVSNNGVDAGHTLCLVAYSGFGDPIGAGDVFADALAFGDVALFNHDDNTLIHGLNYTPFTIDAPRISGGTLVVGGNAVPEPATWAMMILGFGFLGSVLRRRRAFAHA